MVNHPDGGVAKGRCPECGRVFRLTRAAVLYAHSKAGVRCVGTGQPPADSTDGLTSLRPTPPSETTTPVVAHVDAASRRQAHEARRGQGRRTYREEAIQARKADEERARAARIRAEEQSGRDMIKSGVTWLALLALLAVLIAGPLVSRHRHQSRIDEAVSRTCEIWEEALRTRATPVDSQPPGIVDSPEDQLQVATAAYEKCGETMLAWEAAVDEPTSTGPKMSECDQRIRAVLSLGSLSDAEERELVKTINRSPGCSGG